jgi:hypothetical protein
MASYENYQIDEKKYENSDNIFVRKAKTGRKENKSDEFWENFEDYIDYYRKNPQRFCTEYLGLNLHDWQQFIIYCMFHKYNTIFLASRGSGKTWVTMVFCLAFAILYPGVSIGVASSTKKQSALLLGKAKELQKNYPMIAREIEDIFIGKDEATIRIHGGSEITTVVANDNARGLRCQIFIVDERNEVDKEIIDTVFIPFLSAKRQPPYLKHSEYANMDNLEMNHFIELSSIGSKSDSLYEEFENYIRFIGKGIDDYCVFSIPYQIPYKSGVIDKKLIQKMIRENTRGTEAFKQEMEVIPGGSGESAMFRFEDLNKNRKLHIPLIPITEDEFIEFKGDIRKYPYFQKKEDDELRVISYDIALLGGKSNDLSVFTVFRLTPFEDVDIDYDEDGNELRKVYKRYLREISYIETSSGRNIELQMLRFKQLFYDLDCDRAVIDAGGSGQAFLDLCTKKTQDQTRGVRYPAWRLINENEVQETRVLDDSAEKLLFFVKIAGGSATQEHAKIVSRARLGFQKKYIKLLLHEDDVVDELNKRYKYNLLRSSNNIQDNETAQRLISPFYQTTKLIEEGINTRVIDKKGGGIEIDERSGRKDRLMSMLYGLYFIDTMEEELQSNSNKHDIHDYVSANSSDNQNQSNTRNPFSNNLNKLKNFGRR